MAIDLTAPPKSKGEIYEGIAFQFCKVATVTLLAGRFALPAASGLCAIFYVMAVAKGKNDTRCILKHPLLIAGLWGTVCVVSTALLLNPTLMPHVWPMK